MTQGFGNTIRRLVRPGIVTGPIFSKELRCAGRRKRHYALRCAYLALLTVFLVLVWMTVVDRYGRESIALRISKMPEAGKRIILAIVWFQFIATQLVAVILMSTSISDGKFWRLCKMPARPTSFSLRCRLMVKFASATEEQANRSSRKQRLVIST